MEKRTFDFATMISIISGRMFTSMEKLYDALNFLTQETIYTHQIPKILPPSAKHILKTYPELEDIGKDVIINSEEEAERFIKSLSQIFGNEFTLEPMSDEEYSHTDPFEDLKDLIREK